MLCSGYKVTSLKACFKYIRKYQSFPMQILIHNTLHITEVNICLCVSHSEALPSILEIVEEFWP